MNYNISWSTEKIRQFLVKRFDDKDEFETTFKDIRNHFLNNINIDRTPDWVLIASLGALQQSGIVKIRAWKHDQVDMEFVKIIYYVKNDTEYLDEVISEMVDTNIPTFGGNHFSGSGVKALS
ncbi:hypothetical protein KAJ27_13835 [bacterium]|nr:hypothetical protein [bacterium]